MDVLFLIEACILDDGLRYGNAALLHALDSGRFTRAMHVIDSPKRHVTHTGILRKKTKQGWDMLTRSSDRTFPGPACSYLEEYYDLIIFISKKKTIIDLMITAVCSLCHGGPIVCEKYAVRTILI